MEIVPKAENETEESPSGLGQVDKKVPFGGISVRFSKRYHWKQEHGEDGNLEHKKALPQASDSLVNILLTSMKLKKKEYDDSSNKQSGSIKYTEDKLMSVMQIRELIHSRQLERAFRGIKFMEKKLIEVYQGKNLNENMTQITMQAQDVDLLYGYLFDMVRSIVKETMDQEVDESLVTSVVYVLENEAIIHENSDGTLMNSEITLGQPRRWKYLWKEVVKDSVSKRIESVPLNLENESWLPKQLENLKNTTVQDLKKVKNSLISLYPQDYKVCSTYFQSFHDALSSHIQKNVVIHASSLSQLYCLLDFIVNTYKSEEFMGKSELHPEMKFSIFPPLNEECLEKLKRDYNTALEKKWEKEEEVEDEEFKELPLYVDIEQIIGTHVKESSKLSEEMEKSTFHSCVEQLGSFSTRLQTAFMEWSSGKCSLLTIQYAVIYINSLIKLRNPVFTGSLKRTSCLIRKPHFQKLITKEWLSESTAFSAIEKSASIMCQGVMHLTSPYGKDMACRVHNYLVKKYIVQMMKQKIRLTQSNLKKATQKIKKEGDTFTMIANEMGSDQEGLIAATGLISEIIGSNKKEEMKSKLEELYHHYPDVREDQISCILHLQGTGRNRDLQEHFRQLQKSHSQLNGPKNILFSDTDYFTPKACSVS